MWVYLGAANTSMIRLSGIMFSVNYFCSALLHKYFSMLKVQITKIFLRYKAFLFEYLMCIYLNNNNFFILGKQIYNKIVAKIIKNNRIPKIKQTKYNIINRTKMLNRLVFHLTDQYRVLTDHKPTSYSK